MSDILAAPATRKQLERFIEQPTPVLLLVGPRGIGKSFAAAYIAAGLLGVETEKLDSQPFTHHLTPENQSISITQIRTLQKKLQKSVPGSAATRQVVIIEHADLLTTEAQNALLKTLEEPPEATICILTANHAHELLPTIVSRTTQKITLYPVSEDDTLNFFQQSYAAEDIKRAFTITAGRPGLMSALLGDREHSLFRSIEEAKQVLTENQFERLARSTEIAKREKSLIQEFLDALLLISLASLRIQAKKNNRQELSRWLNISEETLRAQRAILQNAQARLVLSNLFLAV